VVDAIKHQSAASAATGIRKTPASEVSRKRRRHY
jgi:hypothetical protein